MNNYNPNNCTLVVCNGKVTVKELSETYGVTREEIIYVNRLFNNSNELDGNLYDINLCLQSGTPPNEGSVVFIPPKLTGGIEESTIFKIPGVRGAYNENFTSQLRPSVTGVKRFNCYFMKYANGDQVKDVMYLPVYPQEFSDTNSAQFTAEPVLGRSVDYQIYNGSSRSVSFTLQLHEEIVNGDYDYIHRLVSEIESANYPEYASGKVKPPEIAFNIGSHFSIRGILESCSANWKAPIVDGRMVNCDLSLGIKETTGPYKMSKIAQFKGRRWDRYGLL